MIYTFRINDGTDCPVITDRDLRDDAAALRYASRWANEDNRTVTVFRGTERQVAAGNARRVGEVRE